MMQTSMPSPQFAPALSGTVAPTERVSRPSRLATSLVLLVLVSTVFEGAARKWLLGGAYGPAGYAAYLSKDFIFAALLIFSVRYSRAPALRAYRTALVVGGTFIVLGAALSAVSGGVSPVGAALTLRALIVLPVLSWLVVTRLPSSACPLIARSAAIFTVLNCVLGVVQNRLPQDHFLNQYAVSDMYVIALISGVRAAGTFAYITGLAVMATVGTWAGLALLSLTRTVRETAVGWMAIGAGIGCALASVSRAPIVIAALMIVGWAMFAKLGVQRVVGSIVVCATVVVVFGAVGLAPGMNRLVSGLVERTELTADDEEFSERAFGQTGEAIAAAGLAPFGNGFGFEQVGGNYFSTGNLAFANFEGQFPRIVMDTSILGLAGYLIICAGALYALQIAKGYASPSDRALLLATQLLLASIFYGAEVYNHTASSFAWLIFAVVLARSNSLRTAP